MANLMQVPAAREFDLTRDSLRQLNLYLHKLAAGDAPAPSARLRHPTR